MTPVSKTKTCCSVKDSPSTGCCGGGAKAKPEEASSGGCCDPKSSDHDTAYCSALSPSKAAAPVKSACCNSKGSCNSEPPAEKSCGNEKNDCCGTKPKKSCCDDKTTSNCKDDACCSSPPKVAPKNVCCNETICICSVSPTSSKPSCCGNDEVKASKKSCCDEVPDASHGGGGGCCSSSKADNKYTPKLESNNKEFCSSSNCTDDSLTANTTKCCVSGVEMSAKSGGGGCCSSSKADTETNNTCNPNIESNNKKECCSSSTCINIPVTKSSTCCSTNGCCADDTPSDHLTCLAVIRPDNITVDVFDVKGHSRAFRSKNKQLNQKMLLSNKLCFAAHGAQGENIDGMLTYCFDSNGEHGEPDEGCFCGEEEPHLHAHIHDPETCGKNNCGGGGNQSLRVLSQLTLHLVEGEEDNAPSGVASMPITSSMPNQCNSSTLQQHLKDEGLQLVQRQCCHADETKNECGKHRMYKVQHHDHTDFLVHNEESGQLHMEHPCVSCGDTDVHGRFRLLHTRSWMGDEARSKSNKGGDESKKEIRLHFFEPHQEPFRLLDVFSGLFELESGRVNAARPVDAMERRPSSASTAEFAPQRGKSQFFVEKICCASEANQIMSLLGKVKGINDVSVNTTTKTVYVDHDFDLTSATDVANILNAEKFGAHLRKDAALQAAKKTGVPTDAYVKSTFDLSAVLSGLTTDEQESNSNCIKYILEDKYNNDEIKNVVLDASGQTLSVEHRPYFLTAPGIVDVLDSHMYDVSITHDGGADGLWALALMDVDQEDTIDQHKTSVRPTTILSGVFWIISMFSLIGGNWDYLKYVALLSVAFGLPPIAAKALRTLRRCHFDVNCMMFFAVLGALPLQEYTESAAVCFLFSISEALESRATARARNALSAIVCLRPEHANVINPYTKAIVVLPASVVAVGSLVSVRTGDKIPCDGVVVEGKSHVDESTLTGESRPISKSKGSTVSGGTINTGSTQLVVKTTATSESSAVSRLIRLVEEAQSNRSETEKMVDTFAKIYTPFVVLAAFCMCTIPWAFGNEAGIFWSKNALVTIVIACPCALIISTPVTYVAGLTAAAQRGVIVKGGQHLESLGRTKSIAFDKTGTLSEGIFQLLELREIGERSRREVLEYLALMEAPASHPLSEAIVKGALNEGVSVPKHMDLKDHTLLPGEGIKAIVNEKVVHVGNKKLFQRIGLYDKLPTEYAALVDGWTNGGVTTGFISIEGEGIIGSYCVADKIRAESKEVLQDLKKLGIEITMLTGDLRPAALGIANQIGIDHDFVKSELLPEDKLSAIENKIDASREKDRCWRANQAVMMVGDGVNDAPALALADVSVAMGEGAALAMETSDVTLMDSDLRKLYYIIHMGKRVIRTIFVNIVFSLLVKGLVGGFMLAGRGSLWAAIATDVGAMLLVTLNGMRLLPSSKKKNDLAAADDAKSDGRGSEEEKV